VSDVTNMNLSHVARVNIRHVKHTQARERTQGPYKLVTSHTCIRVMSHMPRLLNVRKAPVGESRDTYENEACHTYVNTIHVTHMNTSHVTFVNIKHVKHTEAFFFFLRFEGYTMSI